MYLASLNEVPVVVERHAFVALWALSSRRTKTLTSHRVAGPVRRLTVTRSTRHRTLHYITLNLKWKNDEALQIFYTHYKNLETIETTPRINEILVSFEGLQGIWWRHFGCGKLFHVRAVATGNDRSPRADSRVDGISNADVDDNRRRCRPGILATG